MKIETKGEDVNYLATVVVVKDVKPHPNADRLELITIFGNDIVVAKNFYKAGQKLVYFPIESKINHEFLSWGNLFEDGNLNKDNNAKGYFHSSGRVRAIKLRGVASQGFLCEIEKLQQFLKSSGNDLKVGVTFDTLDGVRILEKYVSSKSVQNNPSKKRPNIFKYTNFLPTFIRRPLNTGIRYVLDSIEENNKTSKRIKEGQFKFHYSTPQLGSNVYSIGPDDIIVCSAKLHGTSAVFSNILWKKKFYKIRKKLKKVFTNLELDEYHFTYSSRSVIRNNRKDVFSNDVYGTHGKFLKEFDIINRGYTLYGEIVGWAGPNKMVQKDYDYGVPQGRSEFYVYRMTYTLPDGKVYECEWDEIETYCSENNLKVVPVYYHGTASDMIGWTEESGEDFQEKLLAFLKEKYLDKVCDLCTTGVIAEGVVIRKDNNPNRPVFKYKSPLFNIRESSDRDKGIVDDEETA